MNVRLLTPRRVLVAAVVAGLLTLVLWPVILEKLGVDFHRQWFLDSYAILAASDAVAAGANPLVPNPLDPFNRPHVYSDWWLAIGKLGLTRNDNFLFGGTWVAGFLAVALAGVRPRTYREAVLLAAVLLAPPYILAVQRANNDLVIFAVVGAGLLAVQRRADGWRLGVLGAAIIGATGLKFYPLVAALAPLLVLRWQRSTLGIALVALVGAGLALASQIHAMDRGFLDLPDTIYLFGAAAILRDITPDRAALSVLALVLVGGGGLLAWRRGWTTGLAGDTTGSDGQRLMFAVGALLLLGCFVAGVSYLYRWIFGLWLWPWLGRQAGDGAAPRPARIALGLWLVSLWADGLLCLVVNSCGFSYRPGLGWRYATHAFTWVLMAMLAGWLLEAAWQQLTSWRERRTAARSLDGGRAG